MRYTSPTLLLACLLILTPMLCTQALAKDTQLLRNPTWLDTDGNGLPDEWYATTKRQGTISRHRDDDKRYFRMAVDKAGESVILEQWNAIPNDAKALTVSANIRWKDIVRGKAGWHVGNVQLMFQDKSKKRLGDYKSIKSLTGSSDWTTVSNRFAIPDGAAKYRIQIALYEIKTGSIDVAWISATTQEKSLTPSDDTLKQENAAITKPDPILSDDVALPEPNSPEINGKRGVVVMGPDDLFSTLKPYRQVENFDVSKVDVEGQSFKHAVRVKVKKQPNAVWDMQLRGAPLSHVNKGDVLWVSLYVRAIETESEFAVAAPLLSWQLDKSPWSSALTMRPKAMLKKGWVKFQRAYVAPVALYKDNSAINFQFGLAPQTFELAGLQIYNFGKSVKPEELPTIEPALYEGHQLDHPWRAAAMKRIEKHRKTDLSLVIKDQDGNPIEGAEVKIAMQRHAFHWGTTLYHWKFSGNYAANPKVQKYTSEAKRLFNMVVSENGHKWSAWEDKKGRAANDALMKWAKDNNMDVRGHTSVWPSFRRSPKRIESLKNSPEALRKAINDHIDNMTMAEKGKIYEWDVMNEPTTNYDFMRILGKAEVAQWFKRVASIDPKARLFLNENQIIAGTKIKSLESWLDVIVDNGGPLGGIGIQGHLGIGTATPMRMLEIFDRLSKYKVPLAITELDVLSENEDHQAMYLRDVLIACFSHPSLESVTLWGFWDGRHWKKNTPLFDEAWNPKKGLKEYEDLVLKAWWTNETKSSNAEGKINTRVFKGDYTITVTHQGKTITKQVNLKAPGNITVEM